MKKDYCKPKAVIQDMSVNCFVAGACADPEGVAVLNYGEHDCVYVDANYTIYFAEQCEDDSGFGVNILLPNNQSEYAQLCYHRPLDVLNFFNS